MANKLQQFSNMPVSYFSIVLGLASLGLAHRYAAQQNYVPHLSANILLLAAVVAYCLLLTAYIAKWLGQRRAALDELQHLLLCCFISLIFITTMLLGLIILPISYNGAMALIISGTIAQLLFAAYRTAGLWRGLHSFKATTPLVYLPSVAANFVSASAIAALGFNDIAWLFFGAGLLSWLSFEPAILANLRNSEPMQAPLRAVIGIQLAPAFVAANTYLSLNNGRIDHILLLLVGYGLLQFLYLLRLSRWIFAAGFKPNLWGFSFGLGSMAAVGAHLMSSQGAIGILGMLMLIVGSALVYLMALITIFWLLRWVVKA